MDTWSDSGDNVPLEKDFTKTVYKPELVYNRNENNVKQNMVIQKLTLIQTIEAIFASIEQQEKYAIKITPESLAVLEQLTKLCPQYFKIVENTLMRYVKNNRIDANDVPYIISIINQLYKLLLKYDIATTETIYETSSNILKFIFSIVICEQLDQVDDETEATLLILCCDNIINACIHLVKSEKPLKKAVFLDKPATSALVPALAPALAQPPVVVKSKNWCC